MQFIRTVLTDTIEEKEVKPSSSGKQNIVTNACIQQATKPKAVGTSVHEPVTSVFPSVTWNL